MRTLLLVGLFLINIFAEGQKVDLKHLKCLVCRATIKELDAEVSKIDPNKITEVGNFRMDASGNTINKKVPLSRSEVHISSMLDKICDKMEDYVRATKKSNNQLIIFNLMTPSGTMNPLMSEVDIIQDGDLNKSVQHYCGLIVEEFEDDIVKLYVNDVYDKKEKLCTNISNICNENYVDDKDYNNDNDTGYENKDEL